MGDIQKRAVIDAPVSRVFQYVADAHNGPSYISSIMRVLSGPEGGPEEGQVWRAEVNVLGRTNVINLRLAELQRDRLVRYEIQGEPAASLKLVLASNPSGDRTQVTLLLDVPSVPGIFLNAIMGGLLDGDVERLKAIMERNA